MEARREIIKNRPAASVVALAAAAAASVKFGPPLIADGKGVVRAAVVRLQPGDGDPAAAVTPLSRRQLARLPHREREVVRPREGFDDLSLRANPGVDMYVSGDIIEERDFLRRQLERREGRNVLHSGDVLWVPVIPKDK